jgi:hypothetical protein
MKIAHPGKERQGNRRRLALSELPQRHAFVR